jgi:sugar lactone lactonase YvrE
MKMNLQLRPLAPLIALSLLGASLHAQNNTATLKPAITLPSAITNGVAISPTGATYLVVAKQKGQDVPQIAQWIDGKLRPYPNAAWNSWKPGKDASHSFQHANSIRFSPDGILWVVDVGSPDMGQPTLPKGPKLVGIDTKSARVVRTIYLDSVTKPQSFVDDVRFSGDHAYLTDAGAPGLIVVHLHDGSAYRALEDDPSTTAQQPLRAEGHELLTPQGKPIFFHADQMEISPDGRMLYYQPCSGPLSSIDLQYLNDAKLKDSIRKQHVRPFAHTGTAGGTAIDARGNLYISDTDHNAILLISPGGQVSTLVQDPRLVWVDAMWITADGRLWMPATQLDRTPGFNGGKMGVQYPMVVYTVNIGVGPPRNDHR